MLDIKRIRKNPEEVEELLKRRGDYDLGGLIALDEERRTLLVDMESKKAEQNRASKEIPKLKKEGKDASGIFAAMKTLSGEVKGLEAKVKEVDDQIDTILMNLPNTPCPDVTIGKDENDNVEVMSFMEPTTFDFEPQAHWDLGTTLDILDFERAAKITGARFTLFKGLGARLERAIAAFMLQTHTEKHGYTEIAPPYMVNRASMTGTGQLPKFEDDAFHLPSKDFFLVPTAEVPVTNLHRDEVLDQAALPVNYTAYTPCFRQEAGSAGRDTRGLIRNHQFDKVELVKFVHPDHSYEQLEILTNHAEAILKALKLPYRKVELCTGDIGFSSAKTYDLEVWMPSYNRYVEISSCSNFEDFQARRANIKFRDVETKKLRFVHTLNGSGLAVGRTFAAILENYQNADGSITVPEVLRHFMGVDVIR
jgi:seryl-tRNA synthetase